MNLYLRYFDNEVLVTSMKEAFDFLESIPEIEMDEYMVNDLIQYIESKNNYPKRYKVHGRSYFIIIKTTAATMEEFKANGSAAQDAANPDKVTMRTQSEGYSVYNPGWYEASMLFKRVIQIPQTTKFQYVDTHFAARLKAVSIQDCYNRMMDHLRNRQDVDSRSQFPSIKGRNFECSFLGMNPEA